MSAGSWRAGGVSTTVTRKLPAVVWFELLVAEQLTVVVPTGKVEPLAGEQVTGSVPSTTSVAVATKVTAAPEGPVASVVMSAGRCSAGGVSTTVTWKLPVAVRLKLLVAEQFT